MILSTPSGALRLAVWLGPSWSYSLRSFSSYKFVQRRVTITYIGKSHVLDTSQANVAFQHPLVPFAWLYGWVPPQRPKIEPLIRSLEGGWPAQQWIDVIL
jgi:hypothetical protein